MTIRARLASLLFNTGEALLRASETLDPPPSSRIGWGREGSHMMQEWRARLRDAEAGPRGEP